VPSPAMEPLPYRPVQADSHGQPGESAVERPSVAFVMEQHLGHRTYAENLRAYVDSAVDARWVPIDYAVGAALDRLPVPGGVKAAASARAAVRRGIADADVLVFNTQVPAVLGGRAVRSRRYVVITDVTPIQYDAMAAGYGHRADRPGPVAWLKHRANRTTLRCAAHCVGWSSWVCDSYVNDYDIPRDRTSVIPPGIDTGAFRPGTGPGDGVLRVLFVGGDFVRKGGPELLQAFHSLAGPKELVLVTRSDVADSDDVRVVRDLAPNDPRLVELYRTCDVFALPSRAETFGIAAAEAAAAGLPAIVTDVGGFADIVVDGQTGYRIAPGDTVALADRLRRLQHHDTRQQQAIAARQHAIHHLDARTNAARLLALIRAAANRPVGAGVVG
jgi:glycosyltransferase involved in cell wall biosynthesis